MTSHQNKVAGLFGKYFTTSGFCLSRKSTDILISCDNHRYKESG